ncbi:MAG TPA: N-acetylglucosamine-6-phosphate deacetylase [Clostridiales bacterium]|nr:N-acetylglucosamine-6-phosphate deacetylase [Clostridiales bacterium]HCG35509.1 N-acetylglucosamine-6-phosphate deacetylase [Clostridiales bacterium]
MQGEVTMLLKNAQILDTTMRRFFQGDLRIQDGTISAVGSSLTAENGEEVVDIGGNHLIPGLVDIHSHGAAGEDAMLSSPEKLIAMARHYAAHAVTTLFPTVLTGTRAELNEAMKRIVSAAHLKKNPVTFAGVHIEGPYLSDKRPGCHDISLLKSPDEAEFEEWLSILGKIKAYVTIAPELPGAMDLIEKYTKRGVTFSIGHSDATGAVCREALSRGVGSFTHLYNAMRPLHHRESGVVGTALCTDAYAELICDGVHIDRDVVNMTYRIKGVDKLILVTDSMQAAGMPDGRYKLGSLDVTVENSIAWLSPGTLAGSTLNLLDAIKNLMDFSGASLADAVICATRNPAKAAGLYDKIGSLEKGKDADLAVLDSGRNLTMTISRGRIVYTA